MYSLTIKGIVIFAGAGSGDPDLLTIKASRALSGADIIIADRLVAERILSDWANPEATIIHVGKQSGKKESVPQSAINKMLVDYALAGKRVVRLKGGDVSIFSNIYDELMALVENEIMYEIIPGISSASGAAAYAGIPLTARNHATAIRFLTGYDPGKLTDSKWKELAESDDTLVWFMSSDVINILTENLTASGIHSDVHIAVIEQASTPDQQTSCCNIYDYESLYANKVYASPSLIIIGRVAALHTKFAWFNERTETGFFFKELGTSDLNLPLNSLNRKAC